MDGSSALNSAAFTTCPDGEAFGDTVFSPVGAAEGDGAALSGQDKGPGPIAINDKVFSKNMARFHTLPRCPLTVAFWLLGLDARSGELLRRGFLRTAAPHGSSRYTLGPLTLHSAGLTLRLGTDTLDYSRRPGIFTLNGAFLPRARGLDLCRPFLLDHEAWVVRHFGPDHRARQLRDHRLPPPIRRNVPVWEAYLGPGEGLEALLWTVPASGRATLRAHP